MLKLSFFLGGGGGLGFIVVFAYSIGLLFAPSSGHAFITLSLCIHARRQKQHEASKRKTGRGGDGQHNVKLPPKYFLNLGEVSGNQTIKTGNKI